MEKEETKLWKLFWSNAAAEAGVRKSDGQSSHMRVAMQVKAKRATLEENLARYGNYWARELRKVPKVDAFMLIADLRKDRVFSQTRQRYKALSR